MPFNPNWLTPQVVALAQAIYDSREKPSGYLDQTGVAVLADTLEKPVATTPTS